MPGQGRTIGIILIAVAAVVFVIAAIMVIAQVSSVETTVTGAILGMLIVTLVVVLPLGAGGIYLLVKGKQESAEFAEVEKQKKILNMVLAQGKVSLSEVALEL